MSSWIFPSVDCLSPVRFSGFIAAVAGWAGSGSLATQARLAAAPWSRISLKAMLETETKRGPNPSGAPRSE